jgi:predicted acyltransferase
MPIMKRLWTPPFALLIASGVAACLFLLHLLLDVSRDPAKARRLRVTYPLQAMGKNSLLVYFGSHALNAILGMFPSPGNSIMGRFIGLFGGGWSAEIGVTVFMIAAWMGLAVLLHRHRIYLRA